MIGIPDYPIVQKLIGTLLLGLMLWCATLVSSAADLPSFCERLPRPANAALEKQAASNDWFEVYEIAPGIFALHEPYQWQQVTSYLILGQDTGLLFDTGNGIGNIKAVVDQLTDKPVTVLNSHTHFDHIGGNFQFDKIVSVSTPFSIANSHGLDNDMVKTEVSTQALCKGLPEGVTRASHRIRPFTITNTIKDGDVIDLGHRKLEVLQVPGHTDDSIALLDREAGFLWTGDTFYEGPIWLYFPETDLAAYRKSIARLAALAPQLSALFPAHGTMKASPAVLPEAQKAFDLVVQGKATPVPTREGVVTFEFEGFGFLMREDNTRLSDP
jgi:glyoxylase-like metal-dependent hydrolase (beta-lactamase superfamily II)